MALPVATPTPRYPVIGDDWLFRVRFVEASVDQVVSAAIVNGGTGGTTGTQTVTGTTGTGTRFQASVTIASGAITAINQITTAGAYTADPTALSAEPVTGAGLSGAVLSLTMGPVPLDLTGVSVVGFLFMSGQTAAVMVLTLGGAITLTNSDATLGTVDIVIPASVTATFMGQDIDLAGPNYPNRLALALVDALGRRFTGQVIPLVPVDERTTRVIPPFDSSTILMTAPGFETFGLRLNPATAQLIETLAFAGVL